MIFKILPSVCFDYKSELDESEWEGFKSGWYHLHTHRYVCTVHTVVAFLFFGLNKIPIFYLLW